MIEGFMRKSESFDLKLKWERFQSLLATPVNAASLGVFRIAVGLVMMLEAYSILRPSQVTGGKVPLETYYTGTDVTFNFAYGAFQWLPLLPAPWMHALVWVLGISGLTMALGFCYRLSAVTVFLTWGYFFAIESTRTYWMSYYYLELLITFLMIWMPAARKYSVDARLARGGHSPETVPFWTILILRAQLVIAYFYGGIAKLNSDWLLDAQPVTYFLSQARSIASLEPHLAPGHLEMFKALLHHPGFAYFISYAGAFFDITIGFLLLCRRTRLAALMFMFIFHGMNHFIIFNDLVWFPLLGAATALIFLKPDWPEPIVNWFSTSGPVKTVRPRLALQPSPSLGRWVAPFVVCWLVWQAVIPLRHHLIPGDARFTFEGLAFSWRLKAEVYRSMPCDLLVKDPVLVSQDDQGRARIDWKVWRDEKVLYRTIIPGQIDWTLLPEIVVLREPIIGERVIFNPHASPIPVRTEIEARERVLRIWNEVHGREPDLIGRTLNLSQGLQQLSSFLRTGGNSSQAAQLSGLISQARELEQDELEPEEEKRFLNFARAMFQELHRRNSGGQMLVFLGLLHPFALAGERPDPAPFLFIDDLRLFHELRHEGFSINRQTWKTAASTQNQRGRVTVHHGGEPLIIHAGKFTVQNSETLPRAILIDPLDDSHHEPYVWWNYMQDLPVSKSMHISTQPFILRRYARRVAELWEQEHGRRPAVHAVTHVSLNFRPVQPIVDPEADLASVPKAWFGHNEWIQDLETSRIPREEIAESAPKKLGAKSPEATSSRSSATSRRAGGLR
jgi:vitamin K-dependent gamma-carboxylase